MLTPLVLRIWVGGSGTTASTMIIMLFLLCKYSQVQIRLRDEIAVALPDPKSAVDWTKLAHLPLLEAAINETLRLWPSAPQGTEREVPASSPVSIGSYVVSSGTAVAVPSWSMHHDERYWEYPKEWIPERWITRPELIKDKRAWLAFGHGPAGCVGKYFAMMELKVFLAKVIFAFDIQFASSEDEARIIEGHRDYFTMWYPDLMLRFRPRK